MPGKNKIVEIGNQRILRISKQGGGIGTVTTSIGGIQCGNSCIASIDAGEQVELIATPDSGSDSQFSHWGGDSDCRDGNVTLVTGLFCVAFFTVNAVAESSDCFIATAAYGSWLDPHVVTLREFRDQHLLTNSMGTWFVEFYYRHSPPVADYIREREFLRAIVRSLLAVVIYTIKFPVAAGLMLLLPLLIRVRHRQSRIV